MHADEPDIDTCLVHRLIAAQFPQWAGLPVAPVGSVGTTNAMYRLGDDLVVRLPRMAGAADDVAKEHAWLPRLAASLPAAVPVPVGRGEPAEGYLCQWSVYRWLDGENPAPGRNSEPVLFAEDLAEFVAALRRIDIADGPASYHGEPLAERDSATRTAMTDLRDVVDTGNRPAGSGVARSGRVDPRRPATGEPAGPAWAAQCRHRLRVPGSGRSGR